MLEIRFLCVNKQCLPADQNPLEIWNKYETLSSFKGQSCPADSVKWRLRAERDPEAGLLNVVVSFKGRRGKKESRSAKANKNHWRAS